MSVLTMLRGPLPVAHVDVGKTSAEIDITLLEEPHEARNTEQHRRALTHPHTKQFGPHTIPAKPERQGPDISPKSLLRRAGNVNIDNDGCITLTNNESEKTEVLFDYGRAEGGIPIFDIIRASGQKQVQFESVYSETLKEIHHSGGDGPFFLFSNAMDSYRAVKHTVKSSQELQIVRARHAQRSQRYQKLRLCTADASITFGAFGFNRVRPAAKSKATFSCSDLQLNRIWEHGVKTVDMCTVQEGETEAAWDVSEEGTVVYGQHWAPCRQGTRWQDKTVSFDVKIKERGASWGVHMVANGLIFCLDRNRRVLSASEGLSPDSSVFPSISRGEWPIDANIRLDEWMHIKVTVVQDHVDVAINGRETAHLQGLDIHPLLGGSCNNSGSVAFGGPEGWVSVYRNLLVTDDDGNELYQNSMLPGDASRTFADFAVGTNKVACTMDGAKRDRATFAGDLYIMGRSIAYSTADLEAVCGSIRLLASHQTKEGYLGNLCPIQAPIHTGREEPPTYAFYSLTYALMLIVAIKDYWLHSGDSGIVKEVWQAFERLIAFAEGFVNEKGLIAAPPPLSLTFFPLIGPVFGVSTQINLAFYDALLSMATMSASAEVASTLQDRAERLKACIVRSLWCEEFGILRMSDKSSCHGVSQEVNSYGILLNVSPRHARDLENLQQTDSKLPPAFTGLGRFDELRLCSPYSAAFAVEACFSRAAGDTAVDLLHRIWGAMVDEANPNYSGCHWEAMTLEGEPYHDSTSLVHGWSTCPVYLLPQYLAGLRSLDAGWKKWEARPVYASLEHVDASVPTPAGDIWVQWHFDVPSGTGSVHCRAPVSTDGVVYPPVGWLVAQDECASVFGDSGITMGCNRLYRRLKRV